MTADAQRGRFGPWKWFGGAHRHRFVVLLAVLLLLMLSVPIAHLLGPRAHPVLTRVTVTSLLAAMLLSAMFAVSESRRAVVVAGLLAAPAIVLRGLTVAVETDALLLANYALDMLFLGYVVAVILKHLFTRDCVTFDTICAALCIYLLLAVLWSDAYSLLDVLQPDAFTFTLAEDGGTRPMRFGSGYSIFPLYYSFVTMTTLGYGDILPTSAAARMLAALEAILGQFYLAVLVARLVGLHIAQSRPRKNQRNHSSGGPS